MGAKLTEVIIDSADPERLAGFWSEVLGWPRTGSDDDGAVELADADGAKPTLVFVPEGNEFCLLRSQVD